MRFVTKPVKRKAPDLGNCFVIAYCTDDGAARLTMPTEDWRIIIEATGVQPITMTFQGAVALHEALDELFEIHDDYLTEEH